jgi:hypothetical protein
MNYQSNISKLTRAIVAQKATTNNRTDPAYIEYTLLNFQRIKRWQKVLSLTDDQLRWLDSQKELKGAVDGAYRAVVRRRRSVFAHDASNCLQTPGNSIRGTA